MWQTNGMARIGVVFAAKIKLKKKSLKSIYLAESVLFWLRLFGSFSWEKTVCVFSFFSVHLSCSQETTENATTAENVTDATVDDPVEGTDLHCYECRENYKKEYDAFNSPCLNNVSLVNTRQCTAEHKYCMVKPHCFWWFYIFLRLPGQRFNHNKIHLQVELVSIDGFSVFSIERTCTKECFYGCKYNGYGITLKRCASCCRTNLCNTGSGAPETMRCQCFEIFALLLLFKLTVLETLRVTGNAWTRTSKHCFVLVHSLNWYRTELYSWNGQDLDGISSIFCKGVCEWSN